MANKEGPRDHFVPRFWLRLFAHDPSHTAVYVFDKRLGKTSRRPKGTRGVAQQRGFHTYTGERLPLQDLETRLNKDLETPTAKVIHRLLDAGTTESLEDTDTDVLCEFLAMQALRTWQSRVFGGKLFNDVSDAMIDQGLPRRLVELAAFSEQELANTHLELMDDEAAKLAADFHQLEWSLVQSAPGQRFWIGDNPVVRLHNLHWEDEQRSTEPRMQLVVPLTPQYALLALPAGHGSTERNLVGLDTTRAGQPTHMTSDMVRWANEIQVIYAERYIYSPDRDFELATEVIAGRPEDRQGPYLRDLRIEISGEGWDMLKAWASRTDEPPSGSEET